MRRKRVRLGLDLMIIGVAAVTFAAFYHEEIAARFILTVSGDAAFVFLGFFWGGLLGGVGLLLALAGLVSHETANGRVALLPTLIVLCAVVVVFLMLLASSLKSEHIPPLRPGQTVII